MPEPFIPELQPYSKCMVVHFIGRMTAEDWDRFADFFREKLGEDVTKWDLNTEQMEFIDSKDIGMFVSLNANVAAVGGNMRLIVHRDSKFVKVMKLTKLDLILDIVIK